MSLLKRMVQQNDQLEVLIMYFYNCDPIEVIVQYFHNKYNLEDINNFIHIVQMNNTLLQDLLNNF
jgi:hypothetical protein